MTNLRGGERFIGVQRANVEGAQPFQDVQNFGGEADRGCGGVGTHSESFLRPTFLPFHEFDKVFYRVPDPALRQQNPWRAFAAATLAAQRAFRETGNRGPLAWAQKFNVGSEPKVFLNSRSISIERSQSRVWRHRKARAAGRSSARQSSSNFQF